MFKAFTTSLLFLFSFASEAAIRRDASECLDYNSGVYIGLGVGGMSSVLRTQGPESDALFTATWPNNLNLKVAALPQVSRDRTPFQGVVGDLHFGWDTRFARSHAVIGFMAGTNITNGTGQLNYPTVTVKPNAVTGASDVSAVTSPILMRSLMSGYGAFRFGLTIGRALIYTKVGVSYRYLKAKAYALHETEGSRPSSTAEQNFAMNSARWNMGFLGGVGVDFRLSSSFVLFTSADVVVGAKTRFIFVNAQENSLLTQKQTIIRVRPIFFTGLIGIRYFFPKSQN